MMILTSIALVIFSPLKIHPWSIRFLATVGSITYNEFDITFASMDAAAMPAYLAATFTAYVTRRWTDRKYVAAEQESSEE